MISSFKVKMAHYVLMRYKTEYFLLGKKRKQIAVGKILHGVESFSTTLATYSRAQSGSSQVSVPEFIFQRVLCTDAGLSSSSWGPTAGQILGVPGPAGQVDRLFWRHWEQNGETRQGE